MLTQLTHVLKPADAAWLQTETNRTPMHVGALATFSMPDDADECYLEDLVNRWREVRTFQPPFNYLLRNLPVPRWETLDDDAIDLDYHFRHSAVPSPGGQRALGVLVSRLHSARLNRKHPLWECHVIEGAAADKWSMYIKVHHSLIDGVGGIRLARRLLSADSQTRDMLPPWAVGTGGDQSGLLPKPRSTKVEPATTDGVVGTAVRSTTSVLTSLTRTYAETVTGAGAAKRAVPFRAPRSVLNRRINGPRRFATQAYEVDRLRAVAKAAGGSLNDVFLALCGGALRRYLTELDALPKDSLTANVPVSVRAEGSNNLGNAITFLHAKLGTDIADPLERIQVIRASTQLAKARLPKASGVVMDAYTAGLMGPFLGQAVVGLGAVGRPAFNVVISNVPGLQEQRYIDGSTLEEYYPLSLLFHGQALNITAVSSANAFCIGYTGCRDTLPSLQRVAVYSGEALEELEAALALTWPAAAKKSATSTRRVRKNE
ncbi:MAG: WS/DGAT/MGAT family O-acyltransferase [Mycobacteriales bacterium]